MENTEVQIIKEDITLLYWNTIPYLLWKIQEGYLIIFKNPIGIVSQPCKKQGRIRIFIDRQAQITGNGSSPHSKILTKPKHIIEFKKNKSRFELTLSQQKQGMMSSSNNLFRSENYFPKHLTTFVGNSYRKINVLDWL